MSEKHIYRVIFLNRDEVYEVYAKSVYEGDMYGFVIIEGLVFGERSSVVVDPGEEKLRNEFEGVSRTFVPIHEVIRIDQVKKRGAAKISPSAKKGGDNVASLYAPDKR